MSSLIWYLYEFARKTWVSNFTNAYSKYDIVETPKRFRDFPNVIKENCISCGACISTCPSPTAIKLIREEDSETHEGRSFPEINQNACIRCGLCAEVCPSEPKTLECGENHLIDLDFNIVPSKKIYLIDDFLCIKCKKCIKACPVKDAIKEDENNKLYIDQAHCIDCGKCLEACTVRGAVRSVYTSYLEEQKKVINNTVKVLEEFIESHELDITKLKDDETLDFIYPAESLFRFAKDTLPEEELAYELIEKTIERLILRIILWDSDSCQKCQLCVGECPTGAISFDEEEDIIVRNKDKCLRCSICYQTCPFGVITYYLARFTMDVDIDGNDIVSVFIKPYGLGDKELT